MNSDPRRNRRPDHKSVVSLTQSYIAQEEKIRSIIFEPKVSTISDYNKAVSRALNEAETATGNSNRRFVSKDLAAAYNQGRAKASRATQESAGANNQSPMRITGYSKSGADDIRRSAFIDLQDGMKWACDNLRREIKQVFARLDDGDRNLQSFTNALRQEFADKKILRVKYSNGTEMPVEYYAKMLARSSRIETANVGQFARSLELGSDLVECTIVAPTCEMCAKYQGRVYSISGRDDRFPSLRDTALKYGYSLMHPNCRHEFLPYFEQMKEADELERDISRSNKPFKDTRSEQERNAYAKWQATNRRNRREEAQYREMRAVLGDDMPYKTLSGFRRASRAESEQLEQVRDTFLAHRRLDKEYALVYNDNGEASSFEEFSERLEYKFKKHGMPEYGFTDSNQYIDRAKFVMNAKVDGVSVYGFTDKDGEVFRYHIATNEFAIADRNGKILTLYKPKYGQGNERQRGMRYFIKQIRDYGVKNEK